MLSMTAVKEKEIRLINKGINTRKKITFFTVTAAVYILATNSYHRALPICLAPILWGVICSGAVSRGFQTVFL